MTIRRFLAFLVFAFALLPLVLPARQAVLDDSANSALISADHASPEAAAVLQLVKTLDKR